MIKTPFLQNGLESKQPHRKQDPLARIATNPEFSLVCPGFIWNDLVWGSESYDTCQKSTEERFIASMCLSCKGEKLWTDQCDFPLSGCIPSDEGGVKDKEPGMPEFTDILLIIVKTHEKLEPMQTPQLWGTVKYITAPTCHVTIRAIRNRLRMSLRRW